MGLHCTTTRCYIDSEEGLINSKIKKKNPVVAILTIRHNSANQTPTLCNVNSGYIKIQCAL